MTRDGNRICFCVLLVSIVTAMSYGLDTCMYTQTEDTAGNQNDWRGFKKMASTKLCREFCSSIPECIAAEYSYSTHSCYLYTGPTTLLYNTDRVFMSRSCTAAVTTTSTTAKPQSSNTKRDFTALQKTSSVPVPAAVETTTTTPVATSPTTLHHHTRTARAGSSSRTTPKTIQLPVLPFTYNPRVTYPKTQYQPYGPFHQYHNNQFGNSVGSSYRLYPNYRHFQPYPGYPQRYPLYPAYPPQNYMLRTLKPEVKLTTLAPQDIPKGRRGRLCFNKSKLPNIIFPDERPKFALVPSHDSSKVSLLVVPPKTRRVVCLSVTYRKNGYPILHLPTASPRKAYDRLQQQLKQFVGADRNTNVRADIRSMFQNGNLGFDGHGQNGNRQYPRSTVLVPLLLRGGHAVFGETSIAQTSLPSTPPSRSPSENTIPHTTRTSTPPPRRTPESTIPHTTRTSTPPPRSTPESTIPHTSRTSTPPPSKNTGRNTSIPPKTSTHVNKTAIDGKTLPLSKMGDNEKPYSGPLPRSLRGHVTDVYVNEIARATSGSPIGNNMKVSKKPVRTQGLVDIVLPYHRSPGTPSPPATTRSVRNEVQSWPRDSPAKSPYPNDSSDITSVHPTTPLPNTKHHQSGNVQNTKKTTAVHLKELTTYSPTLGTQANRRQTGDLATGSRRRRKPYPNRKRRRNTAARRRLRRRRRKLYGNLADRKKGKHPGRYARRKYWRRARKLRSLRKIRHPAARRHQQRTRTLSLHKSRRFSSKSRN